MRVKRHSSEKIIVVLREADALLATGATFCGGMKSRDAKRRMELEAENARFKRSVADQALDMTIPKEILAGE